MGRYVKIIEKLMSATCQEALGDIIKISNLVLEYRGRVGQAKFKIWVERRARESLCGIYTKVMN